MTHSARSRRKANVRRREAAESRQKPLDATEQLHRRNANAHAQARRYPVPPLYRPSYAHAEPTQPRCYELQSV